jgi:AraC-like DNA-binding protein
MRSNIKFNFAHAKTVSSVGTDLLENKMLSLQMAKPSFLKLANGNILYHQEIPHFLAHIELFQYTLEQETQVDFSMLKPTFFLSVDLNKDSCHLGYRPAGKYKKTLLAGLNQILLITFRPDWFIEKCQHLTEFKSLIRHFRHADDQLLKLSNVGIAQSLIKSLKKMDQEIDDFRLDNQSYIFINSCIDKYHQKLNDKKEPSYYHRQKATAISLFVTENFNAEIVNDLPRLSEQFMVSERSMARLAKIAFGIPLHEQVTKLRVHFALGQLLITAKPIKEIAELSGYKEPHYFSKVFKKHFGITPKTIDRPYKTAK